MSGITSSENVKQASEMIEKKDPMVDVKEVGNESTNNDTSSIPNTPSAADLIQPQPVHWPAQSGTLVNDPRWALMLDIYDSFLIVVAIVLLLKTSLCIYAWKKDRDYSGKELDSVSPLTTNLIKFNEQVVTAFTIIFVTIMTTVTRRYALYQAQKGAYITDLEQLQASISLPSTIKMVFSLRKFTKFSVTLVFLWCFYYLGSQASKREYAYVVSHPLRPMLALYPATHMTEYIDDFQTYGEQLNRDFMTSLTTFTLNDKLLTYGVDVDSNTLLPDPSYYLLHENGTVNITELAKIHPSETTYMTSVGRPLYFQDSYPSLVDNKTVNNPYWNDARLIGEYSLHTSYIKFQCSSFDLFPANKFPAGVQKTRVLSINTTSPINSSQDLNNSSPQQVEIWQRWDADATMIDATGENFTAPNVGDSSGGAVKTTCNIFEPRIDVDVRCTETACLVTKMSAPVMSSTSLEATILSNVTFAYEFFDSMLSAEGTPKSRDLQAAGYVTGALAAWGDVLGNASANTLDTTTRLSQLDSLETNLEWFVNTYLNLGERQIPLLDPNDTDPAGFDQIRFIGAPWDPHYAVFWQWIAIDYLSSLVLLAAACASFWLRRRTLIPDIFGFVSSLTRDNPHFPVPPGSSTLDGISRTRAMRNVKVRIGDIGGPSGEVGRIGFVPVSANIPVEMLSKNRQYL